MTRNAGALVLGLSLLAVLPPVAKAEAIDGPVRPPVLILLVNKEPLARPGHSYSNTLHVTVMEEGVLGHVTFGDNGWTTVSLEQPPADTLPAGTQLDLDFTVVPQDTEVPLRVVTSHNGQRAVSTYDLSLQGWERANTARALMRSGPGRSDERPAGTAEADDETEVAGRGRLITVHGRISYLRVTSLTDATPIKIGVHGATVRVWDDDPDGRDPMGEDVTDENGQFSVSNYWTQAEEPDIFITVTAENAHMAVLPLPAAACMPYVWETDAVTNFDGDDLAFADCSPADEDDNAAMHILTNLRRARSWMNERGVAPGEPVTVYYPAGDWASYGGGTIWLSELKAWPEDSHIHEYGHHWMDDYGLDVSPPDYCNGNCDDLTVIPFYCTHCEWCEENPQDAWDEGVPNLLADLITRSFATDYGVPALHTRTALSADECDEPPFDYDDPVKTEGFVHMFIYDVMDDYDAGDCDPDFRPGYADVMELSESEVLSILTTERPHTVLDFIEDIRETYGYEPFPDLWETAKHCGYDLDDVTRPDAVDTVMSTSHEPHEESPDATIAFGWSQPHDDFSGVYGYAIEVSESSWPDPGETLDLEHDGAWVTYTTPALPPGEYYIGVRAKDRAGNWSTAYTSAGPYEIRDPLPADIAYGQNYGAAVDGPLVLRYDQTASYEVIQWSEALPGDAGGIYYNIITTNLGDEAVADQFRDRLYVDGVGIVPWTGVIIASLPADTNHVALNRGPITVPAGRHVVSCLYDSGEVIAEPDEANNSTAVQRSFVPPTMALGTVYTRAAPPEKFGGIDHFETPVIAPENKDGLRFDSGSPFGYDAVVVWAADNDDNYDCSLHKPTTSTRNGFRYADPDTGYSTRSAGKIDAVITNSYVSLPYPFWDVGVINESVGESDYTCMQVHSQLISVGDTHTLSMPADDRLVLLGFHLSSSQLGWKEVVLNSDPAAGRLHVAWYPPAFHYGALGDNTKHDATGDGGRARLEFQVPDVGYNLIAVWRDPVDDPAARADSITFDVSVRTAQPDLVLLEEPEGWYSCIVPRPDTEGTPTTVYGPTHLAGDAESTYLNINAYNQGMTVAVDVRAAVELDGAPISLANMGNCPPESSVTVNQTTPVTIPAGRHCLSVDMDPFNTVAEADDDNNRFAEQYVWQPAALPLNGLADRAVPAGPVNGWEAISILRGPLRYNCEGVELPAMGSVWYGAAVLPDADCDVDLRLHEAISGCKIGFGDPVAFSGWGTGESDFVLVNTAVTSARPFHVGLVGVTDGGGSGRCLVDAANSTFLGSDPAGVLGPFEIGPDELLDLHHVVLSAGDLQLALWDDGADDLGFSLHRGDIPFGSKSQPLEDGISFVAPAGDFEFIAVTIPSDGNYCLAVWRRANSGAAVRSAVAYTIEITPLASVPPEGTPAPARTSLVSLYPTPFEQQLTVGFQLAGDEPVKLEIYNVRGQKVRTLADCRLTAGPHTLVWYGDDAAGQQVPSGIYMVRLQGERSTDQRKAVLLR